jgi:hypothetical protein
MKQLFFAHNLVPDAAITASSANNQFPLINLKDTRRTRVFRSTSGSVQITFDLGSIKDIDAVLLVDSGVSGFGFSSGVVQLSDDNIWDGVPTHEIEIEGKFGFAELLFPETQQSRYVKISFENTGESFCEISKIFIGEKSSVGDLSFSYPLTYRHKTNANIQKNRLGQLFIDEINKQKELEGSFNTINKSELEDLFKILDHVSTTIPLWIWFPEGAMTENNKRISGYYFLDGDPSMQLIPGQFWNVGLKFEEGM